MLIVIGSLDRFDSVIEQPLAHAKNLEDRLPAYHTFIRYLFSCGHWEVAFSTCSSILSDLGEDIPVEVDPEIIQAEIVKTQSMLSSFPKNNDFQSLSRLTEPMKIWMMKFMTCAMYLHLATNEELFMVLGCRMIQSSIRYGWCSDSVLGFCAFGQALITFTDNVDEGYFW